MTRDQSPNTTPTVDAVRKATRQAMFEMAKELQKWHAALASSTDREALEAIRATVLRQRRELHEQVTRRQLIMVAAPAELVLPGHIGAESDK